MATEKERKNEARKFVKRWTGRGRENADDRSYWIEFVENVLGISGATGKIEFQKDTIVDNHKKHIDAYISETNVLIEQKSEDKPLDKKYKQSDGSMLTPYEQAARYNNGLRLSDKARWIVASNFQEIWIYDMDKEERERIPVKIALEDLPSKINQFDFMFNESVEEIRDEVTVSKEAGNLVGEIYDAFLEEYGDNPSEDDLKELNILCVRLVFCLYAEDAQLFNSNAFYSYLDKFTADNIKTALEQLFELLDTPEENRSKFISDELKAFPYVNGQLFHGKIDIPPITEKIRDLILNKASRLFDWSEISPTIFGAVFESTLNPETRRSGGMHYTSIENIHKVIDPLFLDELKEEFTNILKLKQDKTRVNKLKAFQDKLASLKFLDPAAGSGNFLTETYTSLRKLENRILAEIFEVENRTRGQLLMGVDDGDDGLYIKVSIQQFYGIEINDFAVAVAKTALWIAENQMMQETSSIIFKDLDFLPLKTNAYIHEGNALRVDWNDILQANECNYIMGNPPFSGTRTMKKTQKEDVLYVFGKKWKSYNSMDYVACWYKKAAEYIDNTNVSCGFVSTNSVVQGEQVPVLWKPLFEKFGIEINCAYQTFVWNSEATSQAKVHCVIIEFSKFHKTPKVLYSGSKRKEVQNISAYLNESPNIFIERKKQPLCDVPEIFLGCTFNDNNNLIMDFDEKEQFIAQYPYMGKYIRPYVMGKDFIARKPRFCFWLKNAKPSDIIKCSALVNRMNSVRKFRLSCKNDNTLQTADTPGLPSMFRYYNNDIEKPFIAIPKVSSQRRRYIPMEMLDSGYIAGDKIFLMPDADIYSFGILTSNVHMSWMRMFCGRLKSDYSYSSTIVYNTFPWCNPTEEQKKKIEETAQGILDARDLFPDSSLADLYDPITMPPELRKAHMLNDIAVMKAYGFDYKTMTESDCVAELMKMYLELTK